jgi:hypothetical protein
MSILQQSPELIDSFAESVNIKKLDPEIRDLLLSDLESKLLEIIQVTNNNSNAGSRNRRKRCGTVCATSCGRTT